ncbi:hypothetical protein E5676_scaffold121G001040 [Cucumis melo var. makuwa]|uniref:Retrotransposon protein n=1 Tax=Cucumis melo var. makuwa TaxID=1194695 RepID=A0A5D3BVI5_CUCMM|nr:hypothetical protein E6C27_scaffold269G001910 [Cucumis melo var. makuwa]TYK03487.1 hypothetical protein E5676_scaffold121G001040 [Cucumis melo var. makuwa]
MTSSSRSPKHSWTHAKEACLVDCLVNLVNAGGGDTPYNKRTPEQAHSRITTHYRTCSGKIESQESMWRPLQTSVRTYRSITIVFPQRMASTWSSPLCAAQG